MASVVDKFPPAAIIAGSLPTSAYTNVIVKTQLKNCSNVWEILVDFMLPSPAKYPLKTAEEATNIIAGARTIKTYFTSGTFNMFFAIIPAPKNSTNEKNAPINVNIFKEVLKILCAPLWSPIATLSDTSLEIIVGIPTDDSVSSNEYTV